MFDSPKFKSFAASALTMPLALANVLPVDAYVPLVKASGNINKGRENITKLSYLNNNALESVKNIPEIMVGAVPRLNLRKVFDDIGLDINQKYNSYEELTSAKNKRGEIIVDGFISKTNDYILKPLKNISDLSKVTAKEEKILVDQVIQRVNKVSDQLLRTVNDSESVSRAQLRSDLLYMHIQSTEYNINHELSALPSFQEKNKQKVLAEKFGYVKNITNEDFLDENIDIFKDLLSIDSNFKARRAHEIKQFNSYVKLTGTMQVSEDLQDTLVKLFPGVPKENFAKVALVEDPSMTFRGSIVVLLAPDESEKLLPVINLKNIQQKINDQNITDPEKIKLEYETVIANELTHIAMKEKFGVLNQTKSFFKNYLELPDYKGMNNFHFNELVSDYISAVINPKGSLVTLIARDEDRYQFSELTAKNFLKSQGFTDKEILSLKKIPSEPKRLKVLNLLAVLKGKNINKLNTDFIQEFKQIGDSLMKHAKFIYELKQTQTTEFAEDESR